MFTALLGKPDCISGVGKRKDYTDTVDEKRRLNSAPYPAGSGIRDFDGADRQPRICHLMRENKKKKKNGKEVKKLDLSDGSDVVSFHPPGSGAVDMNTVTGGKVFPV